MQGNSEMIKNSKIILWIFCFLCSFLAPLPSSAGTLSENSRESNSPAVVVAKQTLETRENTLVLGEVSHSPKKQYKRLKPIVDYAVSHLKDFGIEKGSILIAKNNAEMVQYLREGKIDWVTETPISGVYFSKKTGAELVLRKWKKGVGEYHTVFFARKDSGINSLKDLKGKKIALGDPGSTSSFYVPIGTLMNEKIDLVELSSIRAIPPKNKIGYAFAGGAEINISVWVHRKLADVGAFSNLDWESEKDTPKKFKKNFKVIHHTKPIPRAVELFRKNLNPKIKQRLKQILLNAHNDAEAKEALKAYDKTSKFDEIKGPALSGMDRVGEILNYVQKKIE
jgi:phosphonate transport system substrate-binding protein